MIRKRMMALLALLVLLASACQPEEAPGPAPSSSQASVFSAPEASEPELPAEPEDLGPYVEVFLPDDPAGFTLYLYDSEIEIEGALPFPHPVEGPVDAEQLRGWMDERSYGYFREFELRIHEEVAVLDFSREPGNHQIASCWATLTGNSAGLRQVRFLINGELLTRAGMLDEQGYCTWSELALIEITPEEFTAYRAQVPYAGHRALTESWVDSIYPFYDDPESVAMANFIERVFFMDNYPAHDFSSPAEAPAAFLIRAGISNSLMTQGADSEEAQAVLSSCAGSFTSVHTREQVEETARVIFGEDTVLEHMPTGPYFYNAYTGLYLPNFMDYYSYTIPMILGRRDLGDRWELTVVFLTNGANESWLGLFEEWIDPEDIPRYCREELPRHTVTLLKQAEGGYLYYGHVLPDGGQRCTYSARRAPLDTFAWGDMACVMPSGEEDLPAWVETMAGTETVVLDTDGTLLYLFPVFTDCNVWVERLEWTGGTAYPVETVWQTPEGHNPLLAVHLQVALADPPRYRVTAQHGSRADELLLGPEITDGDLFILRNAGAEAEFLS